MFPCLWVSVLNYARQTIRSKYYSKIKWPIFNKFYIQLHSDRSWCSGKFILIRSLGIAVVMIFLKFFKYSDFKFNWMVHFMHFIGAFYCILCILYKTLTISNNINSICLNIVHQGHCYTVFPTIFVIDRCGFVCHGISQKLMRKIFIKKYRVCFVLDQRSH